MPLAVEVRKDYAEYLLHCLDTGKSIDPPGEGWRVVDMLDPAGACLFGAGSHGPPLAQPDLNDEQEAERTRSFGADLTATVQFLANVFAAVADDEYDVQWAPVMRALVRADGNEAKVTPVEGWR
jgi:hypothetical protein